MGLSLVKNYKDNAELRKSFNELANTVFGINFEKWYEAGFWSEKYVPYSYIDQNKVVANVSVNLIVLVINNEEKRAIQIGTVMTHPDYRGKGLSRLLMEKMLEDYAHYDIIYLFANKSVLDFYPKFGFKRVEETSYSTEPLQLNDTPDVLKLDGGNEEHLAYIQKVANNRYLNSTTFGTRNTAELLMFYCINVFGQKLYFIEEESAIVICHHDGANLHMYDVISDKEVNMDRIIGAFTTSETKIIFFHFTPVGNLDFCKERCNDDDNVLFVKNITNVELPQHFKHPITSQA